MDHTPTSTTPSADQVSNGAPGRRTLALDHIVVISRDVEATLAWYQGLLGLDGVRLEEWRAGRVPFPSLRVNDDTIIDVIPGDPDGRGHVDHVCLVVTPDDLTELRPLLEGSIEDEGLRFGARGVATSVYVRDPDGLLVELRAYPA